jgi:uncharacterized protein with HEPN domain
MKKIKTIFCHIRQDALDIKDYIQGLDEAEFVSNSMVRKAVCMSLINIGELVKTLPDDFREGHSKIPWKQIAGLRDLAAHKYHRLDFSAIWNVAVNRIPELLNFIDRYFDREGEGNC